MTILTFGFAARGGRLTSPGMGQMLSYAERHGPVEFRGASSYEGVVQKIYDAKRLDKSVKAVLAGYSLGTVTCVEIARALVGHSLVDLMFLEVPPQMVVPQNVRRCVNHTVVGGWFILPWWSSDYVSAQDGATELNQFNYASVLGSTHLTVQGLREVHTSFRDEIDRLYTRA